MVQNSDVSLLVNLKLNQEYFFIFSGYCDYLNKEKDVVLVVHCIEMPPMPEKRFPCKYFQLM